MTFCTNRNAHDFRSVNFLGRAPVRVIGLKTVQGSPLQGQQDQWHLQSHLDAHQPKHSHSPSLNKQTQKMRKGLKHRLGKKGEHHPDQTVEQKQGINRLHAELINNLIDSNFLEQ